VLPQHLIAGLFAGAALTASLIAAADIAGERTELFSPGVICGVGSNYAPAFSPDSSLVLFSRKIAPNISILISKRRSDGWSPPVVAPFSGKWVDLESAMSADGSYVIFASNRPASSGVKPLQAYYAGSDQIGGNLWRVDFAGGQWGQPQRLPESVNSSSSVWTPSIARNGDLYFMSTDAATGRFRLHVAPADRDSYAPIQDVSFSTGGFNDVDPVIDPAQRYLIFSSDRARPGTGVLAGPERLFIAFDPRGPAPLVCSLAIPGWEDGSLSQLEARLSRDNRTLYFASRRPGRAPAAAAGPWDDGKAKIWMTYLRPELWRAAAAANKACKERVSLAP
jgi:Tol biopolymer transport system component